MAPNLSDSVKYIAKAACIAVVVYAAVQVLPVERVTSQVTAKMLNFFSVGAAFYEQNGHIYLEYLKISIDCTALEVVSIFLGLILAAHAPLYKRVIFAGVGSAAVFVANIGRIGIVYYLLENNVPWYIAHDLFSGGLAIAAGMLFLLVSEQYLPQINENMYALLDAVESFITSKIR